MDKVLSKDFLLTFCVVNDILSADAFNMLQKVFGEFALSKTRAYEWYKSFEVGVQL